MALTSVEIRHVQRQRELEEILRTTLVSAERSAAELKAQARREALETVDEAGTDRRCASVGESTGEIRRLIS